MAEEKKYEITISDLSAYIGAAAFEILPEDANGCSWYYGPSCQTSGWFRSITRGSCGFGKRDGTIY